MMLLILAMLHWQRTRNEVVYDALVMQFSICMTKQATKPDHSLLGSKLSA